LTSLFFSFLAQKCSPKIYFLDQKIHPHIPSLKRWPLTSLCFVEQQRPTWWSALLPLGALALAIPLGLLALTLPVTTTIIGRKKKR
jgi:hypothetical protein